MTTLRTADFTPSSNYRVTPVSSGWSRHTGVREDQDRGSVTLELADGRRLPDAAPVVEVMTRKVFHLGPWRFRAGGAVDEAPEAEYGFLAGYHEAKFDDSSWSLTHRINEIGAGFPVWEDASFTGYGWYRCELPAASGLAAPTLTLGSVLDERSMQWDIFVDGVQQNESPLSGSLVSCPLTSFNSAIDQVLAVRIRLQPAQENWLEAEVRKIRDPLCHQYLAEPGTFQEHTLKLTVVTETEASYEGEGWRLSSEYVERDRYVVKRSMLTRIGTTPARTSRIDLASVPMSPITQIHQEGAWASVNSEVICALAHPGGVTYRAGEFVRSSVWVAQDLATGESLELPEVVFGGGAPANELIRTLLSTLGPCDARPTGIYDPFGWYQISNATEPKVELDDSMVAAIGEAMTDARAAGLSFEYLALDCGWNDPNDVGALHPGNFPNGRGSLERVLEDQDSKLKLWVSPSDGARAFRHELGLHNPAYRDCESGHPTTPWRLCLAAEPWASDFRTALVGLLGEMDAKAFTFDGLELFCRSEQHGHEPGVWSVYAGASALAHTLRTVRSAGAELLTVYWGFRSPWWLNWADTLWDPPFLVEAAGPSGRPAWTLRGAVQTSLDMNRSYTVSWLPTSRTDSLGSWLANVRWASKQAGERWDDAIVMDLARANGMIQIWGDLRYTLQPDSSRLREITRMAAARAHFLTNEYSLVGDPLSDEVYGFTWEGGDESWAIFACWGESATVDFTWDELRVAPALGLSIDYHSHGSRASARITETGIALELQGSTVLALHMTASAGQSVVGGAPAAADGRISQCDSTTSPDVSVAAALECYLGRVPILSDFDSSSTPAIPLDRARSSQSSLDRDLVERSYAVEADVTGAPADVSFILTARRNGVAWRNWRLGRLVTVKVLEIDGIEARYTVFPHYTFEQAGGWSWARIDLGADGPARSGHYRLEVSVVVPQSVDIDVELWVR